MRPLTPILILITALALGGCHTPVRERADTVTAAAAVLSAASDSLEIAAHEDARQSCPTAEDACLERVAHAWEPVDAALGLSLAGLEVWRQGGGPSAFAAAWADLVRLALSFGVSL